MAALIVHFFGMLHLSGLDYGAQCKFAYGAAHCGLCFQVLLLHFSAADLIQSESAMPSCAALRVSGVGASTPDYSFLARHCEVEVECSTRTIVRNLPSLVCKRHQ